MGDSMQWVWLVVCVVIAIIVIAKITKAVIKIIILAIIVFLFFAGSKVIDLNTISPDLMQKFDAVTEVVGNNLVRTDGEAILVKVKDQWYDISKVSVVGDLATEDIVLEYDGEEIYVGHSGVVNVLRTLNQFGLIEVRG